MVGLVLGIAASYLLAHYVADWIQRRFLLSTGVEYILLGVLLGPSVAGFLSPETLTPLGPLIALAVGWIGLMFGMEMDLRKILTIRDASFRLALLEGLGTATTVAVGTWALFRSGFAGDIEPDQAWLAAAALGCAAWAGSSSAVDLIARRYGADGPLIQSLRRASRFGDMLAIVAFGLLFAVFHDALGVITGYDPGMIEWAAVTIGIGLVLGVLFTVFLDSTEDENPRLLALSGIITFAAGAAFFLKLSTLLVNALLGMVLANSKDGPAVASTLKNSGKPITLVLLLFGGALWRPVDLVAGLALVVAYPVLRLVGKVVGCWVAALGTPIRRDISRGLMAQGQVAVAMAISMRIVFEGPAIDLAYTAVLVSVVVHELIAPRFVKGLLVDAGEIRDERQVGG